MTFKDVSEFLPVAPVDDVGIYNPSGFGSWSLHIYSSKKQVNICFDGSSQCNIVWGSEYVTVYPCPRPGYCDYSAGTRFDPEAEIKKSVPYPMASVLAEMVMNEMILQKEGLPEE